MSISKIPPKLPHISGWATKKGLSTAAEFLNYTSETSFKEQAARLQGWSPAKIAEILNADLVANDKIALLFSRPELSAHKIAAIFNQPALSSQKIIALLSEPNMFVKWPRIGRLARPLPFLTSIVEGTLVENPHAVSHPTIIDELNIWQVRLILKSLSEERKKEIFPAIPYAVRKILKSVELRNDIAPEEAAKLSVIAEKKISPYLDSLKGEDLVKLALETNWKRGTLSTAEQVILREETSLRETFRKAKKLYEIVLNGFQTDGISIGLNFETTLTVKKESDRPWLLSGGGPTPDWMLSMAGPSTGAAIVWLKLTNDFPGLMVDFTRKDKLSPASPLLKSHQVLQLWSPELHL